MKCPRCGNEMTLDAHRRYPINMCYNCGYMEGQAVAPVEEGEPNYKHLKTLNLNEMAAFLSKGLGVDIDKVKLWMESTYRK